MKVALFFLRPWLGGGSTQFTAHLFAGLKAAGAEVSLYRVADAASVGQMQFGDYDILYDVVTMPEALSIASSTHSVLTAISPPPGQRDGTAQALVAAGARVVVHDATELFNWQWPDGPSNIIVRRALQAALPSATYMPHPYVRQSPAAGAKSGAASVARVARSKRTELLLRANRRLPADNQIAVLGMRDGPYVSQLVDQGYGDVLPARDPPRFPYTFAAPVDLLLPYAVHVDMTYIQGDGGGTQYAQLEAADAGCVNVMAWSWFDVDGDMTPGANAVAASGPFLAELLADGTTSSETVAAAMASGNDELLAAHDAQAVATAYLGGL